MLEIDPTNAEMEAPPPGGQNQPPSLPLACQVCGRQDETLRLVILPYVISLVVITFRRAWVGVWCWRHRTLRQVLAGIITASLGWVGIPWGFIYTPAALFKLARGGDQPAEDNAHLLLAISDLKRQHGDAHGSLAIAREALKLQESELVREKIRALMKDHPLSLTRPGAVSPLPFLIVLVAASLTGILIGALDQWISMLFGLFLGEEIHIFIAILTWAPLVAMSFTGGLVLAELNRWAIERTRLDNILLATILAFGSAALAIYGIPQGSMLADFFSALVGGFEVANLGELVQITGAVLTQGGVWMVEDSIRSEGAFGVIYLSILVVSGLYYAWAALHAARESVHWLVRLDLIEGELIDTPERSVLPAWGAIAGVLVAISLAVFAFAGNTTLSRGSPDVVAKLELGDNLYNQNDLHGAAAAYREAIATDPTLLEPHLSLGWTLYNLNDLPGAVTAFNQAAGIDPSSPDPHLGLGYIHLAQDELESAEASFQAALAGGGDVYINSQAYYGLGSIAMTRARVDAAIGFFEEAIRYEWNLPVAHLDLGLAYLARGDFDQAVAKGNDLLGLASDWAAVHALLGLANYQLDNLEKVESELEWAEDLAPQDMYSFILMSNLYWGLQRFDRAQAILEQAIEVYPGASQPTGLLGSVYAVNGQQVRAATLLDTYEDAYPADTGILLARAYLYLQQQNLDAARTTLEEALTLDPQDSETLSDLSFVEFHQGQTQRALDHAQAAHAIYPYGQAALTNLAFAQRAAGMIDEALANAAGGGPAFTQIGSTALHPGRVLPGSRSGCKGDGGAAGLREPGLGAGVRPGVPERSACVPANAPLNPDLAPNQHLTFSCPPHKLGTCSQKSTQPLSSG